MTVQCASRGFGTSDDAKSVMANEICASVLHCFLEFSKTSIGGPQY